MVQTETLPITSVNLSYRRDYPEPQTRTTVEQEDFRELGMAQTSPASLEGQSSSSRSKDDRTHNVNVLHDRTNVERPWSASTNKRPQTVRHISYDGLGEERNPWTQ